MASQHQGFLRLISIPVSPYCELARWAMDRLGLAYTEEAHAPGLHLLATTLHGGGSDVPVLPLVGRSLVNARQVLDWVDSQTPPEARLFPPSPDARPLFDLAFDGAGVAARAWAYAYMLPRRASTVRAWSTGVSPVERVLVRLLFPLLAALVRRSLGLGPDAVRRRGAELDAAFDHVAGLLADGRPYLLGDRFTAADMAFAALVAPAILPDQYQGPLPALDELPPPMRADVERYRASPAGQFALRVYRDQRSRGVGRQSARGVTAPRSPADTLVAALTGPLLLRPAFALLRRVAPILVLGRQVLVSRHADVLEVLDRDADFLIAPINAPRFAELHAPFILGMDRSPQLAREQALLAEVMRHDDLPRIRRFVAETAATLVEAAARRGRIDVVADLTRVVPVRFVGWYFGIPGPDGATMQRWMRVLFHQAFLNVTNNPEVRRQALAAADGLRDWMSAEIARRAASRGAPGQPDDVLGRLLALQGDARPWLDDDTVRRTLAGSVLGAVDTTSKFATLAIDELLRRPAALRAARAAALADDLETVRRYAWEAARFNPHHAFQVRQAARATTLAAGTPRARRVPAGASVLLATLSAMFDADAFDQPDAFRVDRTTEYLHFGHGLHACMGRSINAVQVPVLVAAVLRLPGLRRAPGYAGQVVYDGPFPDHLLLDVDVDVDGQATRAAPGRAPLATTAEPAP